MSTQTFLLVLVAHNGKTLQLNVNSSTRVDAVQQALVSFSGIPNADQIVIFQNARLDPSRNLGSYNLPVRDVAQIEDNPVFLYSRAFLRQGAIPPNPEPLPPVVTQVPGPPPVPPVPHPLSSSSISLVRALPNYEHTFTHHLMLGRASLEAAQARAQQCRQLLSEQEVQLRATDVARANVEAHYTALTRDYHALKTKYESQSSSQAARLDSFNQDVTRLEAMELQPEMQSGSVRRVADLLPLPSLRELHSRCCSTAQHIRSKGEELDNMFDGLRRDVESMMRASPSVDLDAVGSEFAVLEGQLEEAMGITGTLSHDLRLVRGLVEEVVSSAEAERASPSSLTERAGRMEEFAAQHTMRLLPRMEEVDRASNAFLERCIDCKASITRDVTLQLQTISAQQSVMREMKNKIAALSEVVNRLDEGIVRLGIVRHTENAHAQMMAEVARRKAWAESVTDQANKVIQHMAKVREKEVAKREAFATHAERFLGQDLLRRAGLAAEPLRVNVVVEQPSELVLAPQESEESSQITLI